MQGMENVWENGYYLVFRKDPPQKYMPLRNAYRYIAKIMGGDDNTGDIAYNVGDLALSGATLFRPILSSKSWKLFQYIREDFISGWRDLGVTGLIPEIIGDGATGYSIQQLLKDESTDWSKLSQE